MNDTATRKVRKHNDVKAFGGGHALSKDNAGESPVKVTAKVERGALARLIGCWRRLGWCRPAPSVGQERDGRTP